MALLVEKLSHGEHPVTLLRYKDVAEINEAIGRGFILVKFTDTQGGTEIGMSLDKNAQPFDPASASVALSGSLTLDYQPVKCSVKINLETLTGYGTLEPAK